MDTLTLIDGPLPLPAWVDTLTPDWHRTACRDILAAYQATEKAELQADWQRMSYPRESGYAEAMCRQAHLTARRERAAIQPAYDALLRCYLLYAGAYPRVYRVDRAPVSAP